MASVSGRAEDAERTAHTFIFIGGLHRSGTTLLSDILRTHPQISGFTDTGVPMDEGQFLQSIYPSDYIYGGPGRFGFNRAAHLTEACPLATDSNRQRLFEDWSCYWDTGKPFLLEKSPPNLLRTRFLQALFPRSRFIIIRRHPIAVTLATIKWSYSSLWFLLKHWVTCHRIWREDRQLIGDYMELTYEDLISEPLGTIGRVYAFLGLDPPAAPSCDIDPLLNQQYFQIWRSLKGDRVIRPYIKLMERIFENGIREFGYSFYLSKESAIVSPAQPKHRDLTGRKDALIS